MSQRWFALILTFCGLSAAAPIEVNHPVVPFIKRLEEKGLIAPGFWSTLPRSEAEVATALEQARQKGGSLTAWDRRKLERFLQEFDPLLRNRSSRLHYEDSLFTVRGHVLYYTGISLRDSLPKSEAYAFGSLTPGIDATYGEKVYLTASATVGMERNRNARFVAHYDPQHGLPYNTNREGQSPGIPQNVSTFDGFRTVIGFGDAHLKLEAGQDWNQWGPGVWQHTTLGTAPYFWASDSLAPSLPGSMIGFKGTENNYAEARRGYRFPGEASPLPQIRFRVGGDHWEYTKIVARRTGLSEDSSAYLVAHRIELRIGNWKVAGMELLSTGRPLNELALVPGVPLKFMEHTAGDHDNSAMAADAEWTWKGHGRIYGEFFLDDFSGPPLDFWGNKFAWVLGASLQDPLGLPTELHLEYAHVDPWVYGHNQNNTALQSYGALIGSSLPPNSRALFASGSFPLPFDLEGSAEWRFSQHDRTSHGSSIFDDYYLIEPRDDKKRFLQGVIETRNQLSLSAEWQASRFASFKGGAGFLWVQNWKGYTGKNLMTPTLSGEVDLKY